MRLSLAIGVSMLQLSAAAGAAAQGVCSRWSEPAKVGDLDVRIIMESSGIAVARTAQRLYHINDGGRPEFHMTDLQGGARQPVQVSGFMPQDMEDLALAPCGRNTCLYLADIGDNAAQRQSVQIALVREAASFGATVAAEKVITARYPDAAHDAEAIAVHPSTGDLLLVTKVKFSQAAPAQLFRLSAAQMAAGGDQMLELVGMIPVAAMSAGLGESPRRVVTGMAFAPDGRRLALLTYDAVVEMAVPGNAVLPEMWVDGSTHRAFAIAPLLQAEAIAYDGDGRSLIYSTESVRGTAAPLMKQTCQD
jgi:hypothetical protein